MKKIITYGFFVISVILISSFSLYSRQTVQITNFESFSELPLELQVNIARSLIVNSNDLEQSIKTFFRLAQTSSILNSFLSKKKNKIFIRKCLLKHIKQDSENKNKLKNLLIKSIKQANFRLACFLLLINSKQKIIISYADISDFIDRKSILLSAVKNGYSEIVKLLLNSNIEKEFKDIAFNYALKNNCLKIIRLFIKNKANISTCYISFALKKFTQDNSISMVQFLLSNANLDLEYVGPALEVAAENNYVQLFKLILDSLDYIDKYSNNTNNIISCFINSALEAAVQNNHTQIVKLILLNKNTKLHHKTLALKAANKSFNTKIVKLLLSK